MYYCSINIPTKVQNGEDIMAEHVMHKKETKKAPKKSLKEKREDKKARKKDKSSQ
jgi:hypothetical protein